MATEDRDKAECTGDGLSERAEGPSETNDDGARVFVARSRPGAVYGLAGLTSEFGKDLMDGFLLAPICSQVSPIQPKHRDLRFSSFTNSP